MTYTTIGWKISFIKCNRNTSYNSVEYVYSRKFSVLGIYQYYLPNSDYGNMHSLTPINNESKERWCQYLNRWLITTIVEGQRVQGVEFAVNFNTLHRPLHPLPYFICPSLSKAAYNNKNIKFLILTMSGVLSSLVAVRTPDIVRMKIIISLYL